MARVLVTGGTGFVGRELVRQLLDRGDDVHVLSRSQPDASVEWLQADLTDAKDLAETLSGRTFGAIYHAGSLPGDTGDPVEMMAVNVGGLQNLLEFARASNKPRFVLSSSISAYEWYPTAKFRSPDHMPVREDHPCRPKEIYATSKRCQELLAMMYGSQFGLPVTALRITAVIGPGGRGGGAMWRVFAEQMRDGKQVALPQLTTEEMCHFVDLRDVAAMHIAAATHPEAPGQVFNCCGPEPTTGKQFAELMQRVTPGIEVKFGFPWSMAQGGRIAFDMSKARNLLGFEPKYSVEDSIRSIQEWIKAGGLND